jgi:anaerobic magnesium-protoporphyrin IX monomethyl ester cyclase
MRAAFVEPRLAPGAHTVFAGNNALEPLGIEYLASVAMSQGWDVRILSERILGDRLFDELAAFVPQLVAVTSLTCNANRAKRLAIWAKSELNCVTVIGGYHASALPEFFADDRSVDVVVVGEGEHAFGQVLQDVRAGADSPPGRVLGPDRRLPFSALPWPVRVDPLLRSSRLLGLMVPAPSQQDKVAVISASRGCPNSCHFCANQTVWGERHVALRSPQDFAAELSRLVNDYGVTTFFLSDVTMNPSEAHVIGICRAIAEINARVNWYCMCDAGRLTNNMIEQMSSAGCAKIGIGIEHPAQDIRNRVKDGQVPTDAGIHQIVDAAHRHNMLIKGYFMAGYPWETEESLSQFRDAVMKFPIDELKISFYTPFPGTAAYDELAPSLLTRDWDLFDTVTFPVVRTLGVSPETIIQWRRDLFRDFYSSKCYRASAMLKSKDSPAHQQAYRDLETQLKEAGIVVSILEASGLPA